MSQFVIHKQIWYVLQDYQPKHHDGNVNIEHYIVAWMSVPMQL